MKKTLQRVRIYVLLGVLFCAGCGYTMTGTLPEGVQTIAVPTFKNSISQSDRYTYEAGLEIDLTNAVLDRLLYDGNLKVAKLQDADSVLLGDIVRYEQESIRYNETEGVRQYRLFIVVHLVFKNQNTGEIIWEENYLKRYPDQ